MLRIYIIYIHTNHGDLGIKITCLTFSLATNGVTIKYYTSGQLHWNYTDTSHIQYSETCLGSMYTVAPAAVLT